MKRINAILVLILMSSTLLFAQEGKSKSLGVYPGVGKLKKQDLIFSPFISSDWSVQNVLLKYAVQARMKQEISLRFGQFFDYTGTSFSYYSRGEEYDKWPHSFTNLDLNYTLSKRIIQSSDWIVSIGGRVRNRFQISNFDFSDAGQFSYNLASGLDAIAELEYRTSRHSLYARLALPLFSYQARSPYTSQDDQYLERIKVHGDLKIFGQHLKSGTFQSWNTTQMVDVEFGYEFRLSEKWDLGMKYLFVLNRHSSPLQYTSIENLIYLGTTFKF